MIRVRLTTREGGYVVTVVMPPFRAMPEAVIWGNRMFGWHADLKIDGDPCCAEYREIFCYIVTEIRPDPEAS